VSFELKEVFLVQPLNNEKAWINKRKLFSQVMVYENVEKHWLIDSIHIYQS